MGLGGPDTIDGLVKGPPITLSQLDPERAADIRDREQDTDLKRSVAHFSMWVTAAQLGVADAVFTVYAISQWDNIPVAAIDVWLGAAVVQVIGLLAIVSHYLFPNRDQR